MKTAEPLSSVDNNGTVILKVETSDGVVCFRKPIAALPGTESQQLIVSFLTCRLWMCGSAEDDGLDLK